MSKLQKLYSNFESPELNNYLSFSGLSKAENIEEAQIVFLDLEKYVFRDLKGFDFKNHSFDHRELVSRLDHLFVLLEKSQADKPKQVYAFCDLVDIKSHYSNEIFDWSYWNHKFADSKGKDEEAMNKWHAAESKISVDEIAKFKKRREANMGLYLELIKNHLFFTEIQFAGMDIYLKSKIQYGLDIAEEVYLHRMIEERKASNEVKLLEQFQSSPLLSFVKLFMPQEALKTHIVFNSKSSIYLDQLKRVLDSMSIIEVDLASADFVVLLNEQSEMKELPFIDTDAPIFALDLSAASAAAFSYLLLKDEGFSQIYSFAKKRVNESFADGFIRALAPGLLSIIGKKVFNEQIAINYMDDYFNPLAKALGKELGEFAGPINMLKEKLSPKAT